MGRSYDRRNLDAPAAADDEGQSPLAGLAIEREHALAAAQGRANTEGAPRGRSPQDTAKSIAVIATSILQVSTSQTAEITSRATKCMAP